MPYQPLPINPILSLLFWAKRGVWNPEATAAVAREELLINVLRFMMRGIYD
jgi:hypothetical protein